MSAQDIVNKAKKSNEPPVWLMFSAGGSVSAFLIPAVIIVLGILLPLGVVSAEGIMEFARSWFGKLVILVLAIFPMWAGLHRLHHSLHDFKIHLSGAIFYGLAALYSIVVFGYVCSL